MITELETKARDLRAELTVIEAELKIAKDKLSKWGDRRNQLMLAAHSSRLTISSVLDLGYRVKYRSKTTEDECLWCALPVEDEGPDWIDYVASDEDFDTCKWVEMLAKKHTLELGWEYNNVINPVYTARCNELHFKEANFFDLIRAVAKRCL